MIRACLSDETAMSERHFDQHANAFHVEPRPDALLDIQLADLQRLASLGVLTAAVLHEINNALTPAMTYSQLALANPGDAVLMKKALERAVSGIKHANRIAESTLGLAMPSERESKRACDTCATAAIETVQSSVSTIACQAGVSVVTACDHGIRLAMDPMELEQVLVNLVKNSICASQIGGVVHIRCSTQNITQSAVIEVVDEGVGVCASIREKLFRPLATGRVDGHGIGLMVSRRLIEAAGGKLDFDSEHSPGARFVIQLPIK